MRAVLLFLSFVALALCTYHSNVVLHSEPVSSLLPNQIYYTANTNHFSLPNVENPISVEVTFDSGDANSQANVCLIPNQANFPVAGNNLANACPLGGYAVASNSTNTTTQSTKLKFTRTLRDSVRGQLLSKMVEDTDASAVNINAQPATLTAGFAVTTTSTTAATFTVTLIGSYCDAPEFAVNGACVTAKPADVSGAGNTDTVPAGSWLFYTFNSAAFDPTVNNLINVVYNFTNVYIQEGYLPTSTWNIGVVEGNTQVINTPGVTSGPTTWFIGFDNSAGTADVGFSLNVTFAGCAAGLVGPACFVNTTSSNTTLDGTVVIELDASLDTNNQGDGISLDLSDDENAYAYFTLVNLPTFTEGFPYYVRVSVGNNELEDDEDNFGPALYAKLGGYPSAQSNDYAVSGSVANQVFLQVESTDDQWYLAVPTPADFSIWVGVNCPGNCDDNSHGSCLCSGVNGTTVACSAVANSTDYYALYAALPVSVGESAGACTCEDDDYAESFDCSQKSSPTVLFIVLIVIGGLIILFVAIGVPLYCYISNKRKERYERI